MTTGSKTAEFLARAIERSGRAQREIAREAGFSRANILSMMKLGQTKVPISRIPALARACDADPLRFLRIALREYHPEVYAVLHAPLGRSLSENEWNVIDCYRAACQEEEIDIDTQIKLRLISLLDDVKSRKAEGKWPRRHGS